VGSCTARAPSTHRCAGPFRRRTRRAQGRSVPVALGAVVDASFTDLRWQVRRLPELGNTAATVLFFATNECPDREALPA
jgi:hypothetical protein